MANEELLVTGFGPFGTVLENPSEWLARNSGQPHEIVEVSYADVDRLVDSWSTRQGSVLMLGVNARATQFHIELFGRNQVRQADVSGTIPPNRHILKDGPSLVRANLWPRGIVRRLDDPRIRTSRSAGSYLCNYLSYRTLVLQPHLRVGFLHVPPFEAISQAQQLELLRRVVERLTG